MCYYKRLLSIELLELSSLIQDHNSWHLRWNIRVDVNVISLCTDNRAELDTIYIMDGLINSLILQNLKARHFRERLKVDG